MAPTTQNTPLTNNPKEKHTKNLICHKFFCTSTCQGTQRIAGRIYDPWSISAVATRLGPLAQRLGNGPKMMGRKVKVTKGLKIWANFWWVGFFLDAFFFDAYYFFFAYPIFKVSMLDVCIVYSFHTVDGNQKSGQKQTSWSVGTISPLFTGFRTCQVVVWDLFPATVWSTVEFYLFKKKKQNGSPHQKWIFQDGNREITTKKQASSKNAKPSRKQKLNKLEINYNQKSTRRPKTKVAKKNTI